MCAGQSNGRLFLVISKPESFSNITDPEGTLVNTRFLTLFGKALRGFIHVFQGQNPGSVVKGRLAKIKIKKDKQIQRGEKKEKKGPHIPPMHSKSFFGFDIFKQPNTVLWCTVDWRHELAWKISTMSKFCENNVSVRIFCIGKKKTMFLPNGNQCTIESAKTVADGFKCGTDRNIILILTIIHGTVARITSEK